MKRLAIYALAILAVTACDKDSFTEVRPGAQFPFELLSYMTRNQAISRFKGKPSVQVVEQSALSPDDRRPPFSIVRLEIAEYRDHGQTGELRLMFFNDRLTEVVFFPKDARLYLESLKSAGVHVPAMRGAVNVTTHTDHRGKQYVRWEDARLSEQLSRWIERYS